MTLKMGLKGFLSFLKSRQPDDDQAALHGARTWLRSKLGLQMPGNPSTEGSNRKAPHRDLLNGQWCSIQGHELIVVRGPRTFLKGSPEDERDRQDDEQRQVAILEHSFALASREVTVGQYRSFDPNYSHRQAFRSPSDECPVLRIDWHDAARYCNDLSRREGIDESEWCYRPDPRCRLGHRMIPAADALLRSGFRLPTEEEWELCCRAETSTSRPWGNDDELLPDYAWGNLSAQERSWPVGSLRPNPWGFFDLLGNAMECCHDRDQGAEDEAGDPSVSRMLRGGAYYNQPSLMRSADRVRQPSTYRSESIGFRVCRTIR